MIESGRPLHLERPRACHRRPTPARQQHAISPWQRRSHGSVDRPRSSVDHRRHPLIYCSAPKAVKQGSSQVLRCGFCYDTRFETLGELANHLEGKRHRHLFPYRDATVSCPYCGQQISQAGMQSHIAGQSCPRPGQITIPPSQIRRLRQAELDADPRFAPIIQEKIPQGLLKIRPMHQQHTFETALVCTEAFKNSAEPPRFDCMLSELRWHAKQYESDPSPVLRQAVDFSQCPIVEPPDVSDALPVEAFQAPANGLAELFKGPSIADRREKQRLQIAQTWGVWLWIIAELVPSDPAALPEGQDSIVVGATALMFHERLATLEKSLKLELQISTQSLDQNLFLADSPPQDLDHKLAAFIWWTSVVSSYRRQGIAGHLLRACEAVGAAAGFWTFYIQADTELHNHSTFLPFDTREYSAAIEAYKKAGYVEYESKTGWKQVSIWTQAAKLMYKSFRP